MGSLSTPFIFTQGFTGIRQLFAEPALAYQSNWEAWPDLHWIGPEFWGNRLQDWELQDGKTVTEAKADFMKSYEEMKQYFLDTNKDFVECKFNFAFDIASFLNYYSKILSLAGLERITGVNQGQLSHYVTGHRKPGKKTVEKIERKLKKFADELREVEFI